MTSFLKKMGTILAQVGKVFLPISPELATLVIPGTAGSELAGLLTTIIQVEAIGQTAGLTGEQKLSAAAPLIGNAFAQTSVLAGRKMANPQAGQTAVATITGGIADLLNAYDGANLAVPVQAPTPQPTPAAEQPAAAAPAPGLAH